MGKTLAANTATRSLLKNFLDETWKSKSYENLMNRKLPLRLVLSCAITVLLSVTAGAQIPTALQYDGYLLERNKPVTGSRAMEVRLYSSSTGGRPVATERIGAVKVTNGQFFFNYGGKALASKLSSRNNWLAVVVAGREQAPRVQLLAVPFALYSADAQQLKNKIAGLENQLEELTAQLEELQSSVDGGSEEDDSGEDEPGEDGSGEETSEE